MSKHTKGPWSINDWSQDTTDITIGAVLTPLIAKVPLRDVSINEQKDNACRIVACINACEGFSIEELQGADLCKDSIESDAEIIALRQQRDELLEALRGLRDAFLGTSVEVQADAMRAARAAIAKAAGES